MTAGLMGGGGDKVPHSLEDRLDKVDRRDRETHRPVVVVVVQGTVHSSLPADAHCKEVLVGLSLEGVVRRVRVPDRLGLSIGLIPT
jgi:hypothetical protein